MNSESYGRLENYLAQYMSATGGRQEPPHNSNITELVSTANEMETKPVSNGESSDWSPTCEHMFCTLAALANVQQHGAQNPSSKSSFMKTR
jgi:hypothetical protein